MNILIVEDEPVVALDLSATVQHEGCSVCGVAASGEEAVELAAELDPDVVFIDYKLEGELNGLEAASRIKASQRACIVFVTAQQDQATRRAILESEPFALIPKPFCDRAITDVLDKVRSALQRDGASRPLSQTC